MRAAEVLDAELLRREAAVLRREAAVLREGEAVGGKPTCEQSAAQRSLQRCGYYSGRLRRVAGRREMGEVVVVVTVVVVVVRERAVTEPETRPVERPTETREACDVVGRSQRLSVRTERCAYCRGNVHRPKC